MLQTFIGLREVEVKLSDDGSANFRFVANSCNDGCQRASNANTGGETIVKSTSRAYHRGVVKWNNDISFSYSASWAKLFGGYFVTAVHAVPIYSARH